MNRKGKSVRKCYGCILNTGEKCVVYEEPHDKWHNSKCTSYNNQELYRKYLEDIEKHPQKKDKEQRKDTAKKHNTEEHHQGRMGKR